MKIILLAKDKSFKLIALALKDRLYSLLEHKVISKNTALATKTLSAKDWHTCLGYPSTLIIQSLNIPNISTFNSANCKICILTKIFSKPYNISKLATELLELISIDLWGLESIASDKYKWFITFINNYT